MIPAPYVLLLLLHFCYSPSICQILSRHVHYSEIRERFSWNHLLFLVQANKQTSAKHNRPRKLGQRSSLFCVNVLQLENLLVLVSFSHSFIICIQKRRHIIKLELQYIDHLNASFFEKGYHCGIQQSSIQLYWHVFFEHSFASDMVTTHLCLLA